MEGGVGFGCASPFWSRLGVNVVHELFFFGRPGEGGGSLLGVADKKQPTSLGNTGTGQKWLDMHIHTQKVR